MTDYEIERREALDNEAFADNSGSWAFSALDPDYESACGDPEMMAELLGGKKTLDND